MKKLLTVLLLLVFIFTVQACDQDADDNGDNGDNGNGETSTPVIEGADDVTVTVGDTFNPREGVSASDEVDGDLTDSIILELPAGLTVVGGMITFEAEGTHTFTYTVYNAAGTAGTASREVTVEAPEGPDPTENMLENGDFSQGTSGWRLDNYEGAAGSMQVVGGELHVTLSGDPWGTAPRVDYAGIDFVQGRTYEVSFEARANTARMFATQVGHIIDPPVEPWFIDFNPNVYVIDQLTTEMQTFSYTFTMQQPSQDGSVTFEFGVIQESDTVEHPFVATTVIIDNVIVRQID